MKRRIFPPISSASMLVFAALSVLPALVSPSMADERGREHRRDGRWHGADIRHFHERDLAVWRSGYWHHGRHAGRVGWWWVVGGVWYYYPAVIKPYPDPYLPPLIELPPPPPAPAAPAPSQFWYYCPDPQGYYPYVPTCPTPWQPVPANAPPSPLK